MLVVVAPPIEAQFEPSGDSRPSADSAPTGTRSSSGLRPGSLGRNECRADRRDARDARLRAVSRHCAGECETAGGKREHGCDRCGRRREDRYEEAVLRGRAGSLHPGSFVRGAPVALSARDTRKKTGIRVRIRKVHRIRSEPAKCGRDVSDASAQSVPGTRIWSPPAGGEAGSCPIAYARPVPSRDRPTARCDLWRLCRYLHEPTAVDASESGVARPVGLHEELNVVPGLQRELIRWVERVLNPAVGRCRGVISSGGDLRSRSDEDGRVSHDVAAGVLHLDPHSDRVVSGRHGVRAELNLIDDEPLLLRHVLRVLPLSPVREDDDTATTSATTAAAAAGVLYHVGCGRKRIAGAARVLRDHPEPEECALVAPTTV